MKTTFTLALVLVLTSIGFVAQAQSLTASSYIEKTIIGPKVGTAIGYEFIDHVEVGGFYQKAINTSNNEETRSRWFEKEFYGAYLAYPVFDDFNTTVKLNIRTGVSNGENFLITPSILANYNLFEKISVGGGIGVRTLRPTWQANVKIRL